MSSPEQEYRKLYFKLYGLNDSLLSIAQNTSATIQDTSWQMFNGMLDELTKLSADSYYDQLRINPRRVGNMQILLATEFSMKVYQALTYLYKTQEVYLDEESTPQKPLVKDGKGQNITQTSVLSQEQQNDQRQHVEVNVEFNQTLTYMTEALVEARLSFPEGTNERSFLDKLKESITTAKTTADLIKMIAIAAAQFGISAQTLSQIFH